MEDFSRLEAIQQHIENIKYDDYNSSQQLIYDEMMALVAWKSFTGKMMAVYKKDFNEQKVKAYNNLIASQRAVNKDIPTMLAKDYIASKCGDTQYCYDFAERTNSSVGYALDALRSILSALKQEMATISYGNQQ